MIYLDSAATTLQKPAGVVRAVEQAITHMSTPGRGGHRAAMCAAKTAFACRQEAAALFGVSDPERVVFTFNATHGLNIAIHSLVRPGNRVVISGYEHNAVTRPLHQMGDVTVRIARGSLFRPEEMIHAFACALDEGADVAICTHVSNVFGFVLPVEEIAGLCRERSIPLIVDASQSAGVLPLDFEALGAAFAAMPGHKGLYGPQGTGLLLCGQTGCPLLFGGTGSESMRQTMPEFLPDRLEAGTPNIAGIAGLLEGIRYVRHRGTARIAAQERGLIEMLADGLKEQSGIRVYRAEREEYQAGVLSFLAEDRDCELAGDWLARRGIALRAGLHCAPLAHESAGTLQTGTLRASVSVFTREWEIELLLKKLGEFLK